MAVRLPLNAENLITQLACAQLGVSVAQVPMGSSAAFLGEVMSSAQCRGVVMTDKGADFHPRDAIPALVAEGDFPELRHLVHTGHNHYDDLWQFRHCMLYADAPAGMDDDVSDGDLLSQSFDPASSTASRTQGDLVAEVAAATKGAGLVADDTVCFTGSTNHELLVAAAVCLSAKAQFVLPVSTDAAVVERTAGEQQATATYNSAGGLSVVASGSAKVAAAQ